MVKLAVLVSLTGSLLKAILDAGLPVYLVVADRKCRALEIARRAKVPNVVLLERTDFSKRFDRAAYTADMIKLLKKHGIDLVAMAGFMTVFEEEIFEHFTLLNTHPSLLPAFKGEGHNAVRDALEAGAPETGCTIHIATAELDAGPILAQAKVPVLQGDTVDTLHERIKEVERVLYPQEIFKYMQKMG